MSKQNFIEIKACNQQECRQNNSLYQDLTELLVGDNVFGWCGSVLLENLLLTAAKETRFPWVIVSVGLGRYTLACCSVDVVHTVAHSYPHSPCTNDR